MQEKEDNTYHYGNNIPSKNYSTRHPPILQDKEILR